LGAWTGGSLGRPRTTRGRLASTYRVLELAVGHDPVRYLVADPQSKGNATRAARDMGTPAQPGPPTSGAALASTLTWGPG